MCWRRHAAKPLGEIERLVLSARGRAGPNLSAYAIKDAEAALDAVAAMDAVAECDAVALKPVAEAETELPLASHSALESE